jgi:hypothetical protein
MERLYSHSGAVRASALLPTSEALTSTSPAKSRNQARFPDPPLATAPSRMERGAARYAR